MHQRGSGHTSGAVLKSLPGRPNLSNSWPPGEESCELLQADENLEGEHAFTLAVRIPLRQCRTHVGWLKGCSREAVAVQRSRERLVCQALRKYLMLTPRLEDQSCVASCSPESLPLAK